MSPTVVLASASPRRAELLAMLGLEFVVEECAVSEEVLPGETPESHVARLAREKARTGLAAHPGSVVIGGDTVVVLDGSVLGKPRSPREAADMLMRLSGRTHRVVSAVALAQPQGPVDVAVETTHVTFRSFDEDVAWAYVNTGEPMDKAGAYGIQGLGAVLVEHVEGDFYTVVGLPLTRLIQLLEGAGYRYLFGSLTPLAGLPKPGELQ